jgi:hypothetical protein
MSNINATILVNIDTTAGKNAINYTPDSKECPILSLLCVGVTGDSGTIIKITPISATKCSINGGDNNARLRLKCDAIGKITNVEIAYGGTNYPDGDYDAILEDPYGKNGHIKCTATGGSITSCSIINAGEKYSGYIEFDITDFIEGVNYEIVPRYIEKTSGSGNVNFIGYKLSYRPFQVF